MTIRHETAATALPAPGWAATLLPTQQIADLPWLGETPVLLARQAAVKIEQSLDELTFARIPVEADRDQFLRDLRRIRRECLAALDKAFDAAERDLDSLWAPSPPAGPPMTPTAEEAYVGALMYLPAGAAARAAALVEPEDLADPLLRIVHACVTRLAAQGVQPDPVAVLADAREHGLTGAHTMAMTAERVADIYLVVPTAVNVGYYAGIVGREAFARRLHVAGERLIQVSEGGNTAVMVQVLADESKALDAMRLRLTDLARPHRSESSSVA